MQSAVLYGLDQPVSNVIKQTPFDCSTGNCTWPEFESLAICNKCTDLTDDLEQVTTNGELYAVLETDGGAAAIVKDGGTALRLSNGLYIDNLNGWAYGDVDEGASDGIFGAVMMTTFGTENATETASMQDLDTLIWSMSMIRVSADTSNASAVWPNLPRSAMECAVFYCVNQYGMAAINGTLQETVQQVPGVTRTSDSWQPEGRNADLLNDTIVDSIAFNSYFSVIPRTDLTLQSPATGDNFNISQAAVDSISSHFQGSFASTLREFNITDDGSKAGRLNGFYMNSSQVQYSPGVMQALFSSEDLNATFTALAASMNNAIRTGADDDFDGAAGDVAGQKGELRTFYRIAWPWISLQGLMVAAGMVFLVVTVMENKRQQGQGLAAPVWKSSSLAVMSRGEAVRDIFDGAVRLQQMREKARTTRVNLFEREGTASYPLQSMAPDFLEEPEQWQGSKTRGSSKASKVVPYNSEGSDTLVMATEVSPLSDLEDDGRMVRR